MIIQSDDGKPFEKPDSGEFLGTIIDVIFLKDVQTEYGVKSKFRIIWALDKNDSEGNPFRVMRQVNAKLSSGGKRPSDFYNIVKDVLGTAPPTTFETDDLIGRSNKLFVIREGEYANIKGILPLPPGAVGPKIPQGFVRAKDKYSPSTSGATFAQAVGQPSTPTVSTPTLTQAVSTQTAPTTEIPQTSAQSAPQPVIQAQPDIVKF